ncbi:hypothetical protein MBLNU457_g0445t2 [Dothideomycetes sp. NU457]
MSIQRLSANVVSQVQSSIRITSLGDVVLGLFDNCLDAEASKIHISLDLERGWCTVEDDGFGIAPGRLTENDLAATNPLANQHRMTEQFHAQEQSFLQSVAALSMITITSKHHQHYSQNTLVIHHGRTVAEQHSHSRVVLLSKDRGTTVTIRDLFGRMPVRIKQRSLTADARSTIEHEWSCIRKRIIALLLARTVSITLTIREVGARSRILLRTTTNETTSSHDRTINLLCLAAQFPHNYRSTFVPVKASTSVLSVKGFMSATPIATKTSQFISINARPYDANHEQHTLYETINRIFDNADFGLESSGLPSDNVELRRREIDQRCKMYKLTKKHLKRDQKGIDRYPVFYLCIETKDSGKSDHIPLHEIDRVVQCLVHGWLEKHHFRPRRLKQKTDYWKDQSMSGQHNKCRGSSFVDQQIPIASNTGLARPSSSSADWSHMRSGNSTLHSTARPSRRVSSVFELAPLSAGHFGGMRDDSIGTSAHTTPLRLSELPADQSSMSPARSDALNTVPWRNLITGETLQIDSRTGMIKTGELDIDPRVAIPGDNAVGRSGRPLLLRKRLANTPSKDLHTNHWMDGIIHDWSKLRFLTGHSKPIPTVQPPRDTCQTGCHHDHARQNRKVDFDRYTAVQLSKSDLREARVIAQVDRKYVLAILGQHDGLFPQQLVLIDQHAASERCILEELLEDLCALLNTEKGQQPPLKSKLGLVSRVATAKLIKDLSFQIPSSEHSQLTAAAQSLAQWGILYDLDPLSPLETCRTTLGVTVISLPPGIVERCTSEPKLIERLIRDEARDLHESTKGRRICMPNETEGSKPDVTPTWVQRIGTCPKGIIDLLNSRACRSAIMFNDVLSLPECEQLVGKLSRCAFPFICAHGRVSMVPLVDMGHHCEGSGWFATATGQISAEGASVIDAFKRWKANRLK